MKYIITSVISIIAFLFAMTYVFDVSICTKEYVEGLKLELANANDLNKRLNDFHLQSDLMVNELMVIRIPDQTGNVIGHTKSILVPVHGVKTYPIDNDGCNEMDAIRKAISEYLKDVKEGNPGVLSRNAK